MSGQPVDLAKVGEVGVWGEKPPTKRDNLSRAAEQALEALESLDCGDTYKTHNAASALRQALAEEKPPVKTYAGGKPNYCTPEVAPEVTTEVPCKTHPDAPHGFDRNASHGADRYVCECEGWEPPKCEWVGLTDEEVNELVTNNFNRRYSLVLAIEAKLKEKNSNDPT